MMKLTKSQSRKPRNTSLISAVPYSFSCIHRTNDQIRHRIMVELVCFKCAVKCTMKLTMDHLDRVKCLQMIQKTNTERALLSGVKEVAKPMPVHRPPGEANVV